MRRLLIILLLLVACGGPHVPTQTPLNHEQMISDAVLAHLRAEGRAEAYTIRVQAIEQSMAAAEAQPADSAAAQPIWALVAQSDTAWQVVAAQETFSAQELQALDVPQALWPAQLASSEPTTTQPVSTAAPGSISGRLSYPSESVPELDIYVIDATDPQRMYTLHTSAGQTEYSIAGIAAGTYYVLAFLPPPASAEFGGGYTAAVTCGLSSECTDHQLLAVEVAPGAQVEAIDLTDWYADPGSLPTPLPVTPLATETP